MAFHPSKGDSYPLPTAKIHRKQAGNIRGKQELVPFGADKIKTACSANQRPIVCQSMTGNQPEIKECDKPEQMLLTWASPLDSFRVSLSVMQKSAGLQEKARTTTLCMTELTA